MTVAISSKDAESVGTAIENARGLSPRFYTDPEIYAAETEKLFRGGWLCAARVDQVPEPGDYVTLDLMGEPLVVVRGKDAEVRVLSRVCRHRSADIIPGKPQMTQGHAANFACPYHAWSYKLDGKLMAAPMMNGSEVFEKENCGLPVVRSEIWQGWVFVNLAGDAEPLSAQLGELDAFLAPYDLDNMVAVGVREFDSPWNWKVLVDNFMEAYHHIATHKNSLQPMLPAKLSHVPDNGGPYSLLVMPANEDGEHPEPMLPARDLPQELATALVAGVVFPFHLFAVNAESLTWYQILPLAHDRFELRTYACADRSVQGNAAFDDAVAFQKELLAGIHMEDIGACDAVWAGMQSRHAESGPLCAQERSLQQFSHWWFERMGAS